MIIHISGAPGSGKSTIGKYIKDNYPKVLVYDIDDIYDEFILFKEKSNDNTKLIIKNFAMEFQALINDLIKINNHKTIIFVGLNYPDPRMSFRSKEIFVKPFKLDLGAKYKFYIDIPFDQIAKQYFVRTLKETINDIDLEFIDILNNGKYIINIKEIVDDSKWWKNTFLREGYKMITPEKIKIKMDLLLNNKK